MLILFQKNIKTYKGARFVISLFCVVIIFGFFFGLRVLRRKNAKHTMQSSLFFQRFEVSGFCLSEIFVVNGHRSIVTRINNTRSLYLYIKIKYKYSDNHLFLSLPLILNRLFLLYTHKRKRSFSNVKETFFFYQLPSI